MSARRILLLGNLEGSALAAIEGVARQTSSLLSHHTRADDAIRDLDAREWRAVLVDITTPGASRFCQEARARRALFNVPLVGMTPQLTDLAFTNAFRWGVDDVVLLGLAGPLATRLTHLPEAIQLENPARGEAVVADADRGRCDVIGRVLANAGYTVRYAMDLLSTRYYLRKREVTLFVLNEDLGSPPALIQEARALGNEASWVIAAKQLRMEEARDALKDFERVAVMGSHGPPENVLFALDYLSPKPGDRRRSQIRTLHGAIVHFRGEGEEEDECGYTYSVSHSGLYVRTLLPAPPGNLWLELEPPKAARRVRLLGNVVWTRPFGKRGAETAPPGFGVKLLSGLGDDLSLWQSGWDRLDGSHPDSHAVPEVKFTPEPFRVPLPESLSQPPRAPYVSRKSAPIIAITGRRSSDELRAVTIPAPIITEPPSADELRSVTIPAPVIATAPPAAPLPAPEDTSSRLPAPPEPPPTTEPMGLRIPRPDAEQLRNSLAPRTRRVERDAPATAATVEIPSLPGVQDRVDAPADTQPIRSADGLPFPEVPVFEPSPNTQPVSVAFDAPAELVPPIAEVSPGPPPKTRRDSASHHEGVPLPVTVLGPDPMPVESLPATPHPGDAGTSRASPGEASVEPRSPLAISGDRIGQQFAAAPESSSALATGAVTRAASSPGDGSRVGKLLLGFAGAAAIVAGLYAVSQRRNASELAAATQVNAGGAPSAAPALPGVAGPIANETEEVAPPSDGPDTVAEPVAPESTGRAKAGLPAQEEAVPANAPSVVTLAEDETWVRVESRVDAAVFIHGIDLGRTNEWLRSRCGMRFIRLGSAPGKWLSDGVPRRLPCRRPVSIALEPSPATENSTESPSEATSSLPSDTSIPGGSATTPPARTPALPSAALPSATSPSAASPSAALPGAASPSAPSPGAAIPGAPPGP